MDAIMSYVLVPFMSWGQYFFYLAVLLIAANKRFGWFGNFLKLSYKFLIWSVVGFKVVYASVETFSQYYVWSSSGFTKLFLDKSVQDFDLLRQFSGKLFFFLNNRFGYLIFYSWGRFWMEIAVSLLAALAFYLFLVFLKKHKERFFEDGETEMGFLLALMVGWSNFIIFLPLVFLSVVLVSIFRKLVFKEMYTTLGAPFLLAALVVLLFGKYIVDILGLTTLKV